MTDLTKIKTPFGLLDDTTRKELVRHSGPYQVYEGNAWQDLKGATFVNSYTYRVKPSLEHDLELLKRSLKYYADESKYFSDGPDILYDKGYIAREALKLTAGEEGEDG